MKESDNANNWIDPQSSEGFTLFYNCGNYRTATSFDNEDCFTVVSNIANFLLGCGFSPNNVIDCMAETAENLESAWLTNRHEIDPEIKKKWRLDEE